MATDAANMTYLRPIARQRILPSFSVSRRFWTAERSSECHACLVVTMACDDAV